MAITRFKNYIGALNLIDMVGGFDGFKLLLQRAGYSRNAVNENMKKITDEIQQASLLQGKHTTIGKMYRELLLKFAS